MFVDFIIKFCCLFDVYFIVDLNIVKIGNLQCFFYQIEVDVCVVDFGYCQVVVVVGY